MADTIAFTDFKKLDIRIATILEVSPVEGSEKLLKVILDLGDEKRQILAGVAKFFEDPQQLVGKQVPILVNLEPRQMMGEMSNGMMLAADEEGKPVLLNPAQPVKPGSIVM